MSKQKTKTIRDICLILVQALAFIGFANDSRAYKNGLNEFNK